jgi:hypothetical protein
MFSSDFSLIDSNPIESSRQPARRTAPTTSALVMTFARAYASHDRPEPGINWRNSRMRVCGTVNVESIALTCCTPLVSR